MMELELEHPFDAGGKHQRIENENIIKANTPRGDQLFRIYRVNPTLKSIKAYAHHISYDLLENHIEQIQLVNATPPQIMTAIKNKLMVSSPFTFETDLEGTKASFSVSGVNPMKAILSNDEDKDSVYKLFGGELVRDNFTIRMLKNAGADRGVQIRYGKNLIGLSVDEDDASVINRLIPIGKNGLKLPEKYINAAGTIDRIRIGTAEFNDAADVELRLELVD